MNIVGEEALKPKEHPEMIRLAKIIYSTNLLQQLDVQLNSTSVELGLL